MSATTFAAEFRSSMRGMSPYRRNNLRTVGSNYGTQYQPLSDDQLRGVIPSAFAEGAHHSRSDRYGHIPTHHVISALRKEGFVPMFAAERAARKEDKLGYTKHMIRFTHAEDQGNGKRARQVVLVNSHDGSSSYHLMAGIIEMLCLNGCIVADADAKAVKVPHKGDVVRMVIDGSYEVLDEGRIGIQRAEEWQGIELDRAARQVFAEEAHRIRFANAAGEVSTVIRPEALLIPRRAEEHGRSDLWTTFQIAQENAVRGGVTGRGMVDGRMRNQTSRAVTGIDGNVKLNQELWSLADRIAQLRQAGVV